MTVITPCLWFADDARQAVELYVELVPDSRITGVVPGPPDSPPVSISFELGGRPVLALSGRPDDVAFSDAVSLRLDAPTQAEIDRYWHALTAEGGSPGRCGWLRDRFGVSWQVVPPRLGELLGHPDPAAAHRVMQAMLAMDRIVLADLEAAAAAAG